jgi:hypothetical protein
MSDEEKTYSYFIVIASVIDDDFSVKRYIESYFDMTLECKKMTQAAIIGNDSVHSPEAKQYFNYWHFRQRLNPQRNYRNYVINTTFDLLDTLSVPENDECLIPLIVEKGSLVRL